MPKISIKHYIINKSFQKPLLINQIKKDRHNGRSYKTDYEKTSERIIFEYECKKTALQKSANSRNNLKRIKGNRKHEFPYGRLITYTYYENIFIKKEIALLGTILLCS